jgi:hypothetical protein
MNKVYIVKAGADYEGEWVVKVFDTEEKAIAMVVALEDAPSVEWPIGVDFYGYEEQEVY